MIYYNVDGEYDKEYRFHHFYEHLVFNIRFNVKSKIFKSEYIEKNDIAIYFGNYVNHCIYANIEFYI